MQYRYIRRQMFELGMSQNDLAAAIGRSPCHISMWLNRKAELSAGDIPKIAMVLEIEPENIPAAFWPELYGRTAKADNAVRMYG